MENLLNSRIKALPPAKSEPPAGKQRGVHAIWLFELCPSMRLQGKARGGVNAKLLIPKHAFWWSASTVVVSFAP